MRDCGCAPRLAVIFWVRNAYAPTPIHAGAQGDSGGPLYWVNPQTGLREALGIVSQGRGEVTCPSSGLSPDLAPRVNVGNVHFGPGRKAVTPSVFLSAAELETLRDLAAAGFTIEARAIPSEPPAGMGEIETLRPILGM